MEVLASIRIPSEQALDSMRLLVYVAPVALYLMVLGLVNSKAAATLVDSRSDFIALTAVFLPLLLLPVPGLIRAGYAIPCALAGLALGLLFYRLLPRGYAGWVVYNLSGSQATAVVERCLRSLGWDHRWTQRHIVDTGRGFSVEITAVPLLRNVSLHIRPAQGAEVSPAALGELRKALAARLSLSGQLPSLSGCCLLLLGVLTLILPLSMMSRHSDAIADVVTRLLLF